jgi:sec-independent protein translocase protein TatA
VFDDVFQGFEWVIFLFIILLIFGPNKIPQLARSLGQAVWEFKRASQGLLEESEERRRTTASSEGKVDEETVRKLAEKLGVTADGNSVEKKPQIVEVAVSNPEEKSGDEAAVS